MMVDPDIPPANAGGATSELLHWMQSGLVSANTTTTIGGQKVFALINPTNTTPIASYIGPSPPNKSPTTHRYTQMLLNTTGNSSALASLTKAGATRGNFSATNVVKNAGLNVLFGNSFDVSATNTTASSGGIGSNSTSSSGGTKASASTTVRTTTVPGATATGKANGNGTSAAPAKSTGGVAGRERGDGAILAGLGAMAAAIIIL